MSVLVNLSNEQAELLVDVCQSWLSVAHSRMESQRKIRIASGQLPTREKRAWKQEQVEELLSMISNKLSIVRPVKEVQLKPALSQEALDRIMGLSKPIVAEQQNEDTYMVNLPNHELVSVE